jgi:hypothetical protein
VVPVFSCPEDMSLRAGANKRGNLTDSRTVGAKAVCFHWKHKSLRAAEKIACVFLTKTFVRRK